MGALLPMNIFLRQEIDRIQRVIREVHSTLCDLKLAIDGTIVMSAGLKESLDAMYDARIPETWQKVKILTKIKNFSMIQFFTANLLKFLY
jgi:dynein heavy chain